MRVTGIADCAPSEQRDSYPSSRSPERHHEHLRDFNTTGPVVAERHYCIPPLARLDPDGILELVNMCRYFVLDGLRQTGKTSVLLALRDHLNGGAASDYRRVYANVEIGETAREDVAGAMRDVSTALAYGAEDALGDCFLEGIRERALASAEPHGALKHALSLWAREDTKPLVLLIDEIDAPVGHSLLAVLRQIRAGYDLRPNSFSQSIVLCGLRDIRDFRIRSGSEGKPVSRSSAFNIVAESMRLGDFTREDVTTLLAQHTRESGQEFTEEAVETVWNGTQGQPWLVNAICREACFKDPRGRDRARPVTPDLILNAQERLILNRVTHLDHLAWRLQEKRVQRVVEPILSGSSHRSYPAGDLEYARDLGLLARTAPPRIANPIYGEVVPWELTAALQSDILQEAAW